MLIKKIKNNHLLMSGFFKGFSGFSMFIVIPILISFLGNENYGLWILVFTLFQWVLLMDFGIQSSLKTKIPVLLINNEIEILKNYIKSTYKISILISLIIFITTIGFLEIIDIRSSLNIDNHSRAFVNNLFLINIFFFCLIFVANIHKSLYVAFLKGKHAEESIAVNQFLFLISIIITNFFLKDINVEKKLILISILNGLICFAVNLFYTVKFFHTEKLNLKTSERSSNKLIYEILGLGIKYMIIQLGTIFIFTSDNYLIANNFTPAEVVPYDTITKIFQLPIMIFFAAFSPLWSMFTKDYFAKDYLALSNKFKKFNIYFIGILVLLFLMVSLCPILIPFWIKQKIEIPHNLIFFIAFVTALRIIISFYSFFLNGIGKLNNYIYIILMSALLKIPITYYFINLNFGINSIIISTFILMIIWAVLIPLESYIAINKIKTKHDE